MRQDYDDYDTGNEYGRSSAVSWLVMGAAALGFLGLGWYAFSSSDSGSSDADIVTLDAYEDPYKHEPADKGGMEFPHQDKTIYDALDGNTRDEGAETLFPEPEAPVIPEIPETAAAEPENEGDAQSYVAEVPVAETAEKAAEVKEAAVKKAEAKVAEVKIAEAAAEAKKLEAAKPIVAEKVAPVVVEKPKPVAAPKPAPVVVKAPTPPATPVKSAAMGGSYAVQLGAFKSEAEAKTQWGKIIAKHGSILGGSTSVVVRADLPNGTFYRLRAVGFASEAAAKSACASLTKAGQGCFFAGK